MLLLNPYFLQLKIYNQSSYKSNGLLLNKVNSCFNEIKGCQTREGDTMSGQIVFPPHFVDVEGEGSFLAGPIKGTEFRWQDAAIQYIQEHAPWLNVFSPRRSVDRAKDYTKVMYNEQIAWETEYLKRAAFENGVVVFWFAKEEVHYCERPFARTTRIEFGRFFAYHEIFGIKIVVGIEEGFDKGPEDERDGADYIRELLKDHPDIPICDTLEETLDMAIFYAYANDDDFEG